MQYHRRTLILAVALCACSHPTAEQQLILEDQALLDEFDQLQQKFRRGQLDAAHYREELLRLRRLELDLAARVRRSGAASSYWFRTRLKYSSRIEEALNTLPR